MTAPIEKRRYTIAEYLATEEKATDRHEFHDGEILAFSLYREIPSFQL